MFLHEFKSTILVMYAMKHIYLVNLSCVMWCVKLSILSEKLKVSIHVFPIYHYYCSMSPVIL